MRLEQKYREFSKAAQLPEQKERLKVLYTDRKSIEQAEGMKNKRALDTSLLYPSGNGDAKSADTSFDLDKAKAEYAEFIKTVPENRRMYLQRAFEGATFQKVDDPTTTYQYYPKDDIIRYNSDSPLFSAFSFNTAVTHELAHRIDFTMFFETYKNSQFTAAINAAKDIIDKNPQLFVGFVDLDNYGYLADIFSALSEGEHSFRYEHEKEYWKTKYIKGFEVFADMFSIEAMNAYDLMEIIKTQFPDVYDAYNKMF